MAPIFNVSYRKVGGLHFVRIGRFGFSFYISRAFACLNPEIVVDAYPRPRLYKGGSTLEVNRDTCDC